MHDPKKTAPTFLVFGGGLVFLAGMAVAWGIDLTSGHLLPLVGRPVTTGFVVATSALATMGMQWTLIVWWRWWIAPQGPRDEGERIRLTPDKRERLQTGQRA